MDAKKKTEASSLMLVPASDKAVNGVEEMGSRYCLRSSTEAESASISVHLWLVFVRFASIRGRLLDLRSSAVGLPP
jgi:hypothetical protein